MYSWPVEAMGMCKIQTFPAAADWKTNRHGRLLHMLSGKCLSRLSLVTHIHLHHIGCENFSLFTASSTTSVNRMFFSPGSHHHQMLTVLQQHFSRNPWMLNDIWHKTHLANYDQNGKVQIILSNATVRCKMHRDMH